MVVRVLTKINTVNNNNNKNMPLNGKAPQQFRVAIINKISQLTETITKKKKKKLKPTSIASLLFSFIVVVNF